MFAVVIFCEKKGCVQDVIVVAKVGLRKRRELRKVLENEVGFVWEASFVCGVVGIWVWGRDGCGCLNVRNGNLGRGLRRLNSVCRRRLILKELGKCLGRAGARMRKLWAGRDG